MQKPCGPNALVHLLHRESGKNARLSFRQNIFGERLKVAQNLYRKDLISHTGCVNAIEFSQDGEYMASGGDDRNILLWHLETALAEKQKPCRMKNQHLSNIFCLGFNSDNTRIFSGGNDDAVIVHDVSSGETIDVFTHPKPVYGLSIDTTNEQIFATACEDGKLLIFDLRLSAEVLNVAKCRAPFHAVMFHPLDGSFLVSGNAKEGAALWDLRRPKTPTIRYGFREDTSQSCMSVRFNTLGNQILALRRRLPPILYNTLSPDPICQFYHPDYYNSCTMKSCTFAGEMDEYVLSGSDDFNLYMWRIGDADCTQTDQWVDTNQVVLYGHRSIVNQVRYNSQKCMIASSGVEKVVKIWMPFAAEGWEGGLVERPTGPENPRRIYTHDEYLSMVHIGGQNLVQDYNNQNTVEDPRMMAFFDSLVQQEIEGWNSTDSSDSHQQTEYSYNSSRPTSSQSSDSESVHYFSQRDLYRHRLTNNPSKPPRSIYPNRIAYLIATKRNTLKRLALKGAVNTSNRVKMGKLCGRKLKRSGFRGTRKGTSSKRVSRHGSKTAYRRRCTDQSTDTEVPKKATTKRRVQTFHHNSHFRVTFRRKGKSTNPATKPSDTSSDEDSSGNCFGMPRLACLPTGASATTANSNGMSTCDNAADVPSTSTGITSNGKGLLFRLAQQSMDSDDDDDYDHPPRMPNGVVNGRCGAPEKTARPPCPNTDIYSSHSNSRLSNSSCHNETSTSNDSFLDHSASTGKEKNGNASQQTPKDVTSTPDSGIASTVAGGSSAQTDNANTVNNNVETEEGIAVSYKIFQQKVARVRRNYRHHFGDESNSD
ncbi:DDB1- and CUL4-associated factor 5 [Phlebotomus argentipes]|uniref:DDB1- and CUL4-associated factor 5 n=1 Tax=Phlebotomus argentipes TaxID=94469 RepID=UPI00289353E2|nr:DDB1- and CUL4-associated factor 5 [Phlebotomus argentipes]